MKRKNKKKRLPPRPKKKKRPKPAPLLKKSEHSLYTYYEQRIFAWDDVHFVRRAIKISNSNHFPFKKSKPVWNNYKRRMGIVDPEGLSCFMSHKNAGGVFSITNLDVILGVTYKILLPGINTNFSKVQISSINPDEFDAIIYSDRVSNSRKQYFNYLSSIQLNGYPIKYIKEKVEHSYVYSGVRESFLFTVGSKRSNDLSGRLILESLDYDTASHIFNLTTLDNELYYFTLAKLRNYLQSRIVNKREKFYNENFKDKFHLDRLRSLYHTSFDSWRDKLKQVL